MFGTEVTVILVLAFFGDATALVAQPTLGSRSHRWPGTYPLHYRHFAGSRQDLT
jgi:hypothetical protein